MSLLKQKLWTTWGVLSALAILMAWQTDSLWPAEGVALLASAIGFAAFLLPS